MSREILIEDAEQVVSIAMTRWREEIQSLPMLSRSNEPIRCTHMLSSAHCLLGYEIVGIERAEPNPELKPVDGEFRATVKLDVTPRPFDGRSFDEMRACVTESEQLIEVLAVRHFNDHGWVIATAAD